MSDTVSQQAVFAVCSACKGAKVTGGFLPCRECRGMGQYYRSKQDALYWNFGLDTLHILLRKWNKAVQFGINGLLFLLLVLNVYVLFLLGRSYMFDALPWMSDVFVSTRPLAGAFWFVMIFNLYLFYRMYHALTSSRGKITFEKGVVRGRNINISGVLHQTVVDALDQTWMNVMKQRQMPIRPMQLLATLLTNSDIEMVLARLGLPFDALATALSRQLAYYPPVKTDDSLDDSVQAIMLNAYLIAERARSARVRVTDVMQAIVLADEKVQEIFYDYRVEAVKITNVLAWINFNNMLIDRFHRYRSKSIYKPKGPINRSYTAAATPYLDSFGTDLTLLARAGRLPLMVAREKELEELFRVMEGGKSVVLVGEQGVGKGMIIEGLANQMTAEEVPKLFQDKRLVTLSLPFLVAGAARTGEVQERLLLVLQEILRSGNIILVIEDIHNLVGVSSAGTENIDLSDVLTQEIQRGGVMAISTSSPRDMTQYIERSSLSGVLERVSVLEPDRNSAIQILQANVGAVEAKHKVFFTYEALERTIDLSDRYLHDQFLPAKAINLMTEVGSWAAKRERKLIIGEDIAELVSRKTNIPLMQVTQKESSKLMNLEDIMHERMVDQEEAVSLVASALRRARAELRDEKRPIANFLFLGPTGVGKTELAKTVAESYFGNEEAMIRLDMSEYQNQDSIGRLIGVPGSGSGGLLTENVRRSPFALLLLDEIEKAHADILNIFLQVMDDGRLTDANGRTVDFTNMILVATSNAGAHYIQDEVLKKTPIEQIKEGLIRGGQLRDVFRPEFLNRFDGIVVFKPLSEDDIFKIAGLMLKSVRKRLLNKGIALTVTEAAQRELAQAGFDPIFGARPLRRVIQERVDNALAKYLLEGQIGRRDEVILEVGGKISVKKAQKL